MVSYSWHWGRFSSESLVEKESIFPAHDGKLGRINVRISAGPDLSEVDSLIPVKVDDRRVKQVRAKVTDDQRRNAHIAIFGADFIRWL